MSTTNMKNDETKKPTREHIVKRLNKIFSSDNDNAVKNDLIDILALFFMHSNVMASPILIAAAEDPLAFKNQTFNDALYLKIMRLSNVIFACDDVEEEKEYYEKYIKDIRELYFLMDTVYTQSLNNLIAYIEASEKDEVNDPELKALHEETKYRSRTSIENMARLIKEQKFLQEDE